MADQSEKLAKKEGKGRVGIGGAKRRDRIDAIVDAAQTGDDSDIEKAARKGGEKRRD